MDGLVHSIGDLPESNKKHVSPDLLVSSIAKGITSVADPTIAEIVAQLAERIDELESKQEENTAIGVIPAGIIQAFPSESIPNGFILCDGRELDRSVYQRLFDAIGTKYGNGDGFATFNVPDLRGRFIFGLEGDDDIGSKGGEKTHLLTIDEAPAHRHDGLWVDGQRFNVLAGTKTGYGTEWKHAATYEGGPYTNEVGGSQPHNNMPPYITMMYMISTGINYDDPALTNDELLLMFAPAIGTYMYCEYDPNDRYPGTTWEQVEQGKFLIASGEEYENGKSYGSLTHNHSEGDLSAAVGAANGNARSIAYAINDNNKYTNKATPTYVLETSSVLAVNSGTFNHFSKVFGNTSNASSLPPSIAVPLWHRIS